MADQATNTSLIDLLKGMTADSIEASSLDVEALMLVRIAALVAVDAPVASYLLNLGAASDLDIDPERIHGVLAAVAPIVGTARVVSAASKIAAGDRGRDRVGRARRRGRKRRSNQQTARRPLFRRPERGRRAVRTLACNPARGATVPDVDPAPEPAEAAAQADPPP